MKILLMGTGGVGEAIAKILVERDGEGKIFQQIILANRNVEKAKKLAAKLGGNAERFPVESVDATNTDAIVAAIKKYQADIVMNACDPSVNMSIFDAALDAGINYMDMAMSLPLAHPEQPFSLPNLKLGDLQFAKAQAWEEKGGLALIGSGMDPGTVDVFARYAEKHLFDEIEEIGIRDGANLSVPGQDISFGFSIWTTIEECLNPPAIWEKGKGVDGWYTTEPFSGGEIFEFPEGIGPLEVVNVEHEEVFSVPRYIGKGLKKVTFKYSLGNEFIQMLKYLKILGLDSKEKVDVRGNVVAPRDLVAVTAPNPALQGDKMIGKTCVGVWVKGIKDGHERQVFVYQSTDNTESMQRMGCQAVVSQTAFGAAIMLELLATGKWKGKGVQCPEAFDPDEFIKLTIPYNYPCRMVEMDSDYKRNSDDQDFLKYIK